MSVASVMLANPAVERGLIVLWLSADIRIYPFVEVGLERIYIP